MENAIATIDQDPMLAIIDKLSANPNMDVDVIQRVIDMKMQIMDKEAEQSFNRAMVAAQAEMPTVVKNKKNDTTRSEYADLEQVDRAIRPIYTKHGFSLIFYEEPSVMEGRKRLCVDILHKDGHSKKRHIEIAVDDKGMKGTPNKTLTHADGSSLKYAQRYLTCLVFNISTGKDDDGNGAGKKITEDQVANLDYMLKQIPKGLERFQKRFGVEKVEDLPAHMYASAVHLIEGAGK